MNIIVYRCGKGKSILLEERLKKIERILDYLQDYDEYSYYQEKVRELRDLLNI